MVNSFGRRGAAASVMALLAGGLVAVAAPAQASEICGGAEYYNVAEADVDAAIELAYKDAEAQCEASGWEDVERESDNGGLLQTAWPPSDYVYDLDRELYFVNAYASGTPPELPGPIGPDPDNPFDGKILCGDNLETPPGSPETAPSDSEGIALCSPLGLDFFTWTIRVPSDGSGERWSAFGSPAAGLEPAPAEPVQEITPPPPCWAAAINNCPVGGALRFAAPQYAMVGVPVTMFAYASWRPDANAPSQPTNGTAVIRVDGEDYSGVEFVDGVAQWRFIPETEGMKEFTASGVLFSGLSGANAYIDTVPARTYVLEYDPETYETALKNKRVEVGDTYVITDPNQARSYLEDRYEWSVAEKSDDVCAVYETKKGAVKAKFNGEGKCTVIWLDKESEEEGKYTFIAKK